MFDISFAELMMIAVVGLLVIGPEKLPQVARTVGAYVGRLQRYVAQVKDEVNREVRFEELQNLQQEIKQGVDHVETSMMDGAREAESALASVTEEVNVKRTSPTAKSSSKKTRSKQDANTSTTKKTVTKNSPVKKARKTKSTVKPVETKKTVSEVYALLAAPMLDKLPEGTQMIATAVVTPFFVPMKVAMMAAFVISLPHTLYQLWMFVAPGLYAHEKKLMLPTIMVSSFLFLCGMAFAYFLVFPVVFSFIINSAPAGVAVMTDIAEYLDFVMTLFLAFGFAFEVPIAVVLMAHFGWVKIAQLKEARGYVIVAAFVLAAIFTPPDIISQFMLAVPLWLLYEAGILFAQVTKSKQNKIHADL